MTKEGLPGGEHGPVLLQLAHQLLDARLLLGHGGAALLQLAGQLVALCRQLAALLRQLLQLLVAGRLHPLRLGQPLLHLSRTALERLRRTHRHTGSQG